MNFKLEVDDLVFFKNDPGRVYIIYWVNEQMFNGPWFITDCSIVPMSEYQKSEQETVGAFDPRNVIHGVKPSQLRLV